MPIENELAFKLMGQFSSYVPIPERGEIAEIARVLAKVSEDKKEAEAIVAQMKKTLHFYPKVSDVYEASHSVEAELAAKSLPEFTGNEPACKLCLDMRHVIHSKVIDGVEYSFARPCVCVAEKVSA